MLAMNVIGLDTETHLFSNGNWAPRAVCLQYDDGDSNDLVVGDAIIDYANWVLDEAAAGRVIIVGQNIAYDMAVLAAYSPELMSKIFAAYDAGAIYCTKIRERLLDISQGRPNSQYDLAQLCDRYDIPMKVGKETVWRLRYSELEFVPVKDWPQEALDYALDDPHVTRRIFFCQIKRGERYAYEKFEAESARQSGYDFTLYLMHVWGIRTSAERVKTLLVETQDRIDEIQPVLIKNLLMKKNGSKCMAVIKNRIIKSHKEMDLAVPMTAGGVKTDPAIKTDKETLKKCQDDLLDLVVEHSGLVKVKNTYAMKLIEGITGNIHATFNTLGAGTGRTSMSSPNLQNQKRDGGIRECFVPRDGMDFVSADYDVQELRMLAQACLDICGYSNLAKKFQADPDFDPHIAFACTVMGWTYKDAMKRKAAGDKEVKDKRQQAKAANFGFPGGLGAPNFRAYARNSWGVKIDLEQAQALKDQWFDQWPEMRDYFRNAKWIAETGVSIQKRSGRVRGGVGFCDGANDGFQGPASDAAKTAVYLISKACYAEPDSPLYGCRPVLIIHDEIVAEAPQSYSHEAAMEMKRLMELAQEMWTPDIPARATPIVARCWSKEAEPVWEGDRLIPWEVASA